FCFQADKLFRICVKRIKRIFHFVSRKALSLELANRCARRSARPSNKFLVSFNVDFDSLASPAVENYSASDCRDKRHKYEPESDVIYSISDWISDIRLLSAS